MGDGGCAQSSGEPGRHAQLPLSPIDRATCHWPGKPIIRGRKKAGDGLTALPHGNGHGCPVQYTVPGL